MSAATPLVEKLIKKVTGGGRQLGSSLKQMKIKEKRKYLLSHLLQ
jgi:hypothetical protein